MGGEKFNKGSVRVYLTLQVLQTYVLNYTSLTLGGPACVKRKGLSRTILACIYVYIYIYTYIYTYIYIYYIHIYIYKKILGATPRA